MVKSQRSLWNLFGLFSPNAATHKPRFRHAKRARISSDSQTKAFNSSLFVTSPDSSLETWRTLDLNDKSLSRMSASEIVKLIIDVSPEASKALFDFLRFCNPGFTLKGLQLGTQDENETATAALNEIVGRLEDLHGSFDVLLNRLFISMFLRGAFFAELVFDADQTTVADLVAPDPDIVRFRRESDPVRGQIWHLGQYKDGTWISLDYPNISYLPLDPLPGSPYGRPMISPVIFSALFLIGILHDLRRVIAQQGYPRIDIEIDLEAIADSLGADSSDLQLLEAAVNAAVTEVTDAYAELEPDDAYVHTSVIKVNRPVGTVDMASMGAIDNIIRVIERSITRALKTMPLLMGSNEAVAETHANRQWEIHAASIATLQKMASKQMQRLLKLALRAQGIQADVRLVFGTLRESERLRDAQAEAIEIQNELNKYLAGWQSQDQASLTVTGSEADVPEPRGDMADTSQISAPQTLAKPQKRAVLIVPDGASDPLPPAVTELDLSDDNAESAVQDFEAALPDYAGLLDARVEGRTDFDETTENESDSPWIWNQEAQTYTNTETGERLSQEDLIRLRDIYITQTRLSNERYKIRGRGVDDLVDSLILGDINIQQFVLGMRKEILDSYSAQYMLAVGGRHNMTQAHWGRIGRMLAPDGVYNRFDMFAQNVANGKYSAAQIRNFSRQYINSSTQAFERGKIANLGLPLMPQYPADGNQVCRANCNCNWEIVETDLEFKCYWRLNPGEHCETCVENNLTWNPLIIAKSTLASPTLPAVQRELAGMELSPNGKQSELTCSKNDKQ